MKRVKHILFTFLLVLIIPVGILFCGCSLFEQPVGIVSIEKTDTEGLIDTYTITFTDGSITTFEIKNGQNGRDGQDGKDGEDGIDGIDGKDGKDGKNGKYITSITKTGTEDNVDTYTIRFSNGTSTTFNVTNGKDGKDGEDGQPGEKITLNEIYEEYKNTTGLEISYIEFLEQYLCIENSTEETEIVSIINKNLLSVMKIKTNSSWGSGEIIKIDSDYTYIMTNYHVVFDENNNRISTTIKGYLYGAENEYSLTYIGGSASKDLAVLKIATNLLPANISAVEFADCYHVGQTAIAIGNSKGSGISVTRGIVSVESEEISYKVDNSDKRTFRVLRMDTSIYGGNSGGALFDMQGKLIGVTCAGRYTTEDVKNNIDIVIGTVDIDLEHINFSIPYSVAKAVVNSIIDNNGSATKATLNVTEDSLNYIYHDDLGYGRIEANVKLSSINNLSSSLGLQMNDIIKEIIIDGEVYEVYRKYDVEDALINAGEGSNIKVKYIRNLSEQESIEVTITNTYLSTII